MPRLVWQLFPRLLLVSLFAVGGGVVLSLQEFYGVLSSFVELPQNAFSLAVKQSLPWFTTIIVLFSLVAALLSLLFLHHRWGLPISRLRLGAERFARGDLSFRLQASHAQELHDLAEAMNRMAEQLEERIAALTQERNEQNAVLAGMVEGVIAVDSDERIIKMNNSAASFVGQENGAFKGKRLETIVQDFELQDFVRHTLQSERPIKEELILHEHSDRILMASGRRLKDSAGASLGALIVLNDVTQVRRLENLRKDFVANVSHELRTPITSIKGFVETLQDGAIHSPQEAGRFLKIIASQSERLSTIIEDLLSLARIEQERERDEIPFESGSVKPVLNTAVSLCSMKAAERDIEVFVECEDALQANINASLLEHGVVNLIDNAIKYSERGQQVLVRAYPFESGVRIDVVDHGCGISREHLPRVFERFYRADKARSRKMGGTGLGLAIVKHIAQAHKGYPSVESVIDEGSTFSIVIGSTEPK